MPDLGKKCVPCNSKSIKASTIEISKYLDEVPEYSLIKVDEIERITNGSILDKIF